MRILLSVCSMTWFAVVLMARENLGTEIDKESKLSSDLEAEKAVCNAGNITQLIVSSVGPTWIFLTWDIPSCEQQLYNVSYQVNFTKSNTKEYNFILVNLKDCREFTVEKNMAKLNLTGMNCNKKGKFLQPCTEYNINISAMHITSKLPVIAKGKISTSPDTQQRKIANLTTQIFKDRFSLSWMNSSCPLPRTYNITLRDSRGSKETVVINESNFSTKSCGASLCRTIQSCSEYNVTIVPVYRDKKYQDGVPYETITIRTGPDSPDAKNVTFPAIGKDWFQVQWKLQDCRPDKVQGYKILIEGGNASKTLDLKKYDINKLFAVANISSSMTELLPCTNYSIAIKVVYDQSNVDTTSYSYWHIVTTAASDGQSQVRDIQIVESPRSFNVSWKSPSCNVQVDKYDVEIINKLNNSKSGILEIQHGRLFLNCDSKDCGSIRPCTSYNISIIPIFQKPYSPGKTHWKEVKTLSELSRPKILSNDKAKENEIIVEWEYDWDHLRCVQGFRVQAAGKEVPLTPVQNRSVSFPKLNSCTLYNVTVRAEGLNKSASASAVFWTKDTAPDSTVGFTDVAYVWMDHSRVNISWRFNFTNICFGHFDVMVRRESKPQNQGEGSSERHNTTGPSDQYVIHTLDQRARYEARITMWTKNNDYSVTSNWISISYNEPMSPVAATLIGVVCVLVVIVVLVAVYMVRSRQRNRSTRTIQNGGKTFYQSAPIRRSRPIKIVDLPKMTVFLTALRNLELEKEYQELKLISVQRKSTAESERPENKRKNRYVNILPYDDCRVKLSVIGEDPCTDYINASYIEGINGVEEYIAAQGPLDLTVTDFWRMIWEQDVQIIVMLTSLQENGRVKCSSYWPDVDLCQKFGSVKLENIEETIKEEWVIRKFKVIHGNNQRVVFQYHFVKWPDFGCPENPLSFLDFVQEVRARIDVLPVKNHILVHCSAGVGRTGTFIAVDLLMQQSLRSSEIDIFGTIVKLRSFRSLMVQNEDQYSFVYNCISQFVQIVMYPNQDDDYDNDSVVLLKESYADNNIDCTNVVQL